MTYYVTTSIPYVNANPHLGHALELVQADLLARHRRRRAGSVAVPDPAVHFPDRSAVHPAVRLQSGTDDNSLKNVRAARDAGEPVRSFVQRHADLFERLAPTLDLSYDDFVRTSSDPRHLPAAHRLWRAVERRGDLYQRHYQGAYCVGCEDFYASEDLVDGHCPEHTEPAEWISERNWFFRLERYADQLRELYRDGTIRVLPEQRRNEVLAFIDGGLRDFSVSRSVERASIQPANAEHGVDRQSPEDETGRAWGVGVPGDPDQVMYVWWDALGNYLSGLRYGDPDSTEYAHWWLHGDRRVHVIGKGILRFHAIYWPAMLLSAGEPVPTDIYVHDYLTVEGAKLSKSAGVVVEPFEVVREYGTDPVRWWLLSEVPRVGDTDFTREALVTVANRDLAGGLGNLVQRVTTMVHRYLDGVVPSSAAVEQEVVDHLVGDLPARIDAALERFDPRSGCRAILDAVRSVSQYIERSEPWKLANQAESTESRRLSRVLGNLVRACRIIAGELSPFLPELARKLSVRLDGERLPAPSPAFARVELGGRVR